MTRRKNLQPSSYAIRKYNLTTSIDFDVAVKYSGVLMAIASADGELTEQELDWYIEEQILIGGTEEYIEAIAAIDWRNANIEELLGEIKDYFPLNCSHCLLYQAIKMSRSDGSYHDKEKAAVARAAKILGIEDSVVTSMEALVEMEDATDRLRRAMMKR